MSKGVKCRYCEQEFPNYDNTYMNHIMICEEVWANSHQKEINKMLDKIYSLSEEQFNKILFGR